MPKIPAVFNWSGGKDSTLALHYILTEQKFDIKYLLTTFNEAFNRVAMHGVRAELLIAQASSLKIPLQQLKVPEMPSMEIYERIMEEHFAKLKNEGIDYAIFGDIFLEDLKVYRQQQFDGFGMEVVFPLWGRDSLSLVQEFIALGYKTVVVCAQDGLEDLCGRVIDQSFLDDLPKGIDPCGEHGEFHTFVFDGPIFGKPIAFELGEKIFRKFPDPVNSELSTGYWYIDLISK